MSSSSNQVEVTLVKNPTLGLGITGGRDGENAINPGDPVSVFTLGVGFTCQCTYGNWK